MRDSAGPDPARDALIDDLVAESDRWRLAYETEAAAYDTLHQSALGMRADLLTVRGQLSEATERVDSLVALLEDRPNERAWWMPQVTFGYADCICDGQARHGPSATAGWSIRF